MEENRGLENMPPVPGKKSILPKLVLALGGAAAIVIGGYSLYSYSQGQTCSANPGSPCYTYTQAYKTCLDEYIAANQQFLQEDQAAGIGYTQEQIQYLNNLETCMNNASNKIYSTTKALNLPITQAIEAIAAVIAAVLVARVLTSTYSKLKLNGTLRTNGSDTAASMRQVVLQDGIDSGTITPETASDFQSTNRSMTTDDISNSQSFTQDLSSVLTEEEFSTVSTLTDESIATVQEAEAIVDDELAGLFE